MTLQKDPEGNEKKYLHQFGDFKNKRVLEVGCGEGRLTWKYASASMLTVGVDSDRTALRVARADSPADLRKQVHFTGASARNLPFAKETFDLAILSWSL
jgi:ubiquinone/menaquinone biosynthesis C-methylase UbiE